MAVPPHITPEMGFDEVSRAVLSWLHENVGLPFWSVNRMQGGDQLHLAVLDRVGGAQAGLITSWDESLCRRMVAGDGPTIATDLLDHPAYAEQGSARALGLRTYVGAPIWAADGQLFGALCGLDQQPADSSLEQWAPTVRLLADLLSVVLRADRDRTELTRQLEDERTAADTDVLTGLANRRAWESLILAEESVQRRFGDDAVLLAVDVDGLKQVNDTQGHAAGDELLCTVAMTLAAAIRPDDVVARIGGDEFMVLLRGATLEEGKALSVRLHEALAVAGAPASIGCAAYVMTDGFGNAQAEADRKMYAAKNLSKLGRLAC